ncbi:uncharacterized protein ACIB01_018515 isoform 1-T1 [Guaruba guarouba]
MRAGGEGRECESMNEKCRAPLPPAQRLRAAAGSGGQRLKPVSCSSGDASATREQCGFTLCGALLVFQLVNPMSLAPVKVHVEIPDEHEPSSGKETTSKRHQSPASRTCLVGPSAEAPHHGCSHVHPPLPPPGAQ